MFKRLKEVIDERHNGIKDLYDARAEIEMLIGYGQDNDSETD